MVVHTDPVNEVKMWRDIAECLNQGQHQGVDRTLTPSASGAAGTRNRLIGLPNFVEINVKRQTLP
jgi:hypothetical protein